MLKLDQLAMKKLMTAKEAATLRMLAWSKDFALLRSFELVRLNVFWTWDCRPKWMHTSHDQTCHHDLPAHTCSAA